MSVLYLEHVRWNTGKLVFSLGMLDPVYEGAASPSNVTNDSPNARRNIPEDFNRRAAVTCCLTFRRHSKRSGWAPSFTPLRQSPLEGL